MNFTERVSFAMDKAPEGWLQELSIEEYAALEDGKKKYYEPLYAKYRTKKIRDYDLDYGDFVGWKPIQIGIGEPVGYKYVGYIAARLIDRVLDSNVLMRRILKKAPGESNDANFKRITRFIEGSN